MFRCLKSSLYGRSLNGRAKNRRKRLRESAGSLYKAEKRIAELDILFQRVYEDNVSGKLTDERFAALSASYEEERKRLKDESDKLRLDIEKQDGDTANIAAFVERDKRYTEIKELTSSIVNEFISEIVVSKKQIVNGKKVYPSTSTTMAWAS